MKTAEREWARDLRRERAMSVKEIARLVGVAPSSVSLWVRDIALTSAQLESLRQRNPAYNNQLRGASRNAEKDVLGALQPKLMGARAYAEENRCTSPA